MATYKSSYTGPQIDQAVGNALNKDTSTLSNDVNHIPASSVVKSALDTFVRPNLLDNAYFVGGGSQQGGGQFPINQCGQTSYSGAVYTIDRWKQNYGTVELYSGYLKFSTTAQYQWFAQRMEKSSLIIGATYTLTFLFYDGTLWTITFTANSENTQWLGNPVSGFYVEIQHYSSDAYWSVYLTSSVASSVSASIVAVKLELGPDQTLAHQENGVWVLNEIPNYQQELAKCQRYFQTFRTQSLRPTYGEDCRPVMATTTPVTGTVTIGSVTYYTLSSDL